MASRYRSSIPKAAHEKVVERYPGGTKHKAEYLVRGSVVGVRWFHESGEPSMEYGMKNGVQHGMMYCWYRPGVLTAAEPYVNGKSHGIARQWDDAGRLLGMYAMQHGTGVDLFAALSDVAAAADIEELDEIAASLAQARRLGKGVSEVLAEHERSLREAERNRLLGAASTVQPKLAAILAVIYLPEFLILVVVPLFLSTLGRI